VQKVIIFLIAGISWTGCSVLKSRENISLTSDKKFTINEEKILQQNISTFSFSMAKVEIIIEGNGEKQKLLGNIKYVYPGKFLISLRNSSGIEGARIYIDTDTILANDRINRKTYYCSARHLYEKYGISTDYIPVLLGDLIIEKKDKINDIKCKDGNAEISVLNGQKEIKYIADCTKGKIVSVNFKSKSNKYQINAEFSSFKKMNDYFYPSSIRIDNLTEHNKVDIKVKKAESYTGKDLKFMPGNNYELILLQ
jgi:hypothetical protein